MMSKKLDAFLEFDAKNPVVYKLFDKYACEAVQSGRKHIGANMVIERIRWYTSIETTDKQYKINNNHAPYYARQWMARNPKHKGFFRTRVAEGDFLDGEKIK